VLCFGALSVSAAWLGRRIGTDRAVVLGMLLIAFASGIRLLPSATVFFVSTALLGAAITIGNVLTPTMVKQHVPARHAGTVSGLYTGALIGGAAVASAISAPLASTGLGWRGALAIWAIPAVIAAASWVFVRRGPADHTRRANVKDSRTRPVNAGDDRTGRVVVGGGDGRAGRMNRRVVWGLAVFMGMQSVAYYGVLAWLPALLRDDGVGAGRAGLALSLFNLFGIAAAIVMPALAARYADQRALALAVCAGWGAGLIGLLVAPSAYIVWSVVTGLAQGAAISLALALIVIRARTPDVARRLSGTVQSAGYLIGAAGPFVLGALRDATRSWTASLLALLVATVLMAVGAWGAGRNEVVG
jgi:MFS transporter, CP family, cyanate transporter